MGRLRAKFRVLRVTQRWDNTWELHLAPVMATSEENKSFWDATPAGECDLIWRGPHEFQCAAYYYVELEPHHTGQWTLDSKVDRGYGAGDAEWSMYTQHQFTGKPPDDGLQKGNLKISLDGDKTAAWELLGVPREKWSIKFTLAEDQSEG